MQEYNAVIVGGGFYGCSVAIYLQQHGKSVLLVEREDQLFRHASYANQARIHNGYHYPRSLQTAYRSRVNFPAFIRDFPDCVVNNFTKLYCIGKPLGKVTPRQFERFCDIIGAPWKPANPEYTKLFDPRTIAAVYEVKEFAFDSNILRDCLRSELDRLGVEIRLQTSVREVESTPERAVLQLSDGNSVEAKYIFNCTYAGLKQVPGLREHCNAVLKQEVTEMALVQLPEELQGLGITVMCGPFFSTMPFPPRGLHTLSHVRYTPHASWVDTGVDSPNPYEVLLEYRKRSRAEVMVRDAARFLPSIRKAVIHDSLFEIKTLLIRNEIDDGRPILMERSQTRSNIYSIMGGKVDNIYDVYAKLGADGL